MSEHTPGKLKMESRYSNGCEVGPWLVDDSGKRWIAELIGAPYLGFSDTIPNARRLVAAWNLCDGVPTEMLEASKPLVAVYAEYREMLNAIIAKIEGEKS